jgi:hypothetical protein
MFPLETPSGVGGFPGGCGARIAASKVLGNGKSLTAFAADSRNR